MVNLLPTLSLAQSILKRKFPSVDKPLRIYAPPKKSPSKRAFENYKPRGLFSEFYGIWFRARKVTGTFEKRAPGKHQLKCAVKKMYFFSLLITMFSLVPFGFIRLFMSYSLWILHHLTPTSLPVFFFFFRLGCLSVLYVSFYSFYCIALIDLTPLKLIIFVQYFVLVLVHLYLSFSWCSVTLFFPCFPFLVLLL